MTLRHLLVIAAAGLALAGCGAPAPDVPAGVAQDPTAGPQFASAASTAPSPVAVPRSIAIPRLGITDDVVPVGLAPDGSMEIPDVSESGWYRLGPLPGNPGASLISGHVNYDGRLGALGRIGELKADDRIVVTDVAGVARTFAVYDVVSIPKIKYRALTVPLVFGSRTSRDLELVTCSGPVVNHEYLDNTIVSARLI